MPARSTPACCGRRACGRWRGTVPDSASWPRGSRGRHAMSMRTVDRATIHAPLERVFQIAAGVERWPEILSHYRRVRVVERGDGGGLVEMAAGGPLRPLRYSTWLDA